MGGVGGKGEMEGEVRGKNGMRAVMICEACLMKVFHYRCTFKLHRQNKLFELRNRNIGIYPHFSVRDFHVAVESLIASNCTSTPQFYKPSAKGMLQ